MEMDLLLVVLIAGAFLLGFLRGVMRQLIALATWLVSFILAAQLQRPLAIWLVEQDAQFSLQYGDMLAFGAVFVLIFGVAFVLIEVVGNVSDLTTHAALDEVLGGVLGAGVVVLTIATLIVTLDIFYSLESPGPTAQISSLADAHRLFEGSAIVGWLSDSLIPGLGSLLGILLPDSVRQVMG